MNFKYLIAAIALFITEICIALFIKDAFIRPYVGDYLVVILLACILRAFTKLSFTPIGLMVLGFSYLVEGLQYIGLIYLLRLEGSAVASTVIGTSFAWEDMLAYTLGVLTFMLFEYRQAKTNLREAQGDKI